MKTIVYPPPSGSITVCMCSIMEGISADQLSIVERDMLFDKIAVTGPVIPYWHSVNRRNKFALVLDGDENYVPDRVI